MESADRNKFIIADKNKFIISHHFLMWGEEALQEKPEQNLQQH